MMPYIKNEDKEYLNIMDRDEEGYKVSGIYFNAENPGQLNYSITMLVDYYLKSKGESYQTYNDIVGALECCKIELYRRKIAPYEDKKIQENGDVY